MMMSSGRVLKSHEVQGHDIVSLRDNGQEPSEATTGRNISVAEETVDEALLFTASEVEDLCEKSRIQGASDAGSVLEPALHQIADALEEFMSRDAELAAIAQRSDADAIITIGIDVAKWILGRELSEPHAVLALVERALDQSLTSSASTLIVHPDLATVLGEIAPATVEVLADRDVEIGEFRSRSAGPEISFRFDVALGRAHDALISEDSE